MPPGKKPTKGTKTPVSGGPPVKSPAKAVTSPAPAPAPARRPRVPAPAPIAVPFGPDAPIDAAQREMEFRNRERQDAARAASTALAEQSYAEQSTAGPAVQGPGVNLGAGRRRQRGGRKMKGYGNPTMLVGRGMSMKLQGGRGVAGYSLSGDPIHLPGQQSGRGGYLGPFLQTELQHRRNMGDNRTPAEIAAAGLAGLGRRRRGRGGGPLQPRPAVWKPPMFLE